MGQAMDRLTRAYPRELSEVRMLVAGDKAGSWRRWYTKNIAIADDRLDEHLQAPRRRK